MFKYQCISNNNSITAAEFRMHVAVTNTKFSFVDESDPLNIFKMAATLQNI